MRLLTKLLPVVAIGTALVLLGPALAAAQTITSAVLEGDNVVGVGLVTRIDNVAVNDAGSWLVEADTDHADTNLDVVVLKNGALHLREGDGLADPPGSNIDSFDSINLNNSDVNNLVINDTTFRDTDGGIYIWGGDPCAGVVSNFTFSYNDMDSSNSYGVGIDLLGGEVYTDANFGPGNSVHNNSFVDIPGAYGFGAVSLLSTALTTYELDASYNYWGTALTKTNT